MTEDRFKALEKKIERLENKNHQLDRALTALTEAFMIMLEEEGGLFEEVAPPGFIEPTSAMICN